MNFFSLYKKATFCKKRFYRSFSIGDGQIGNETKSIRVIDLFVAGYDK